LRSASLCARSAVMHHDATSAAAFRTPRMFDVVDCDPCGSALPYLPGLMSAARDGAFVCFSTFNTADLLHRCGAPPHASSISPAYQRLLWPPQLLRPLPQRAAAAPPLAPGRASSPTPHLRSHPLLRLRPRFSHHRPHCRSSLDSTCLK
jgi:hypothetical protein